MSIFITIITSSVAAALSANFAIGRFKKERSLDRKEEAYSLVIKGIKDSLSYIEAYIDSREKRYTETEKKYLQDLYEKKEKSIKDAEKVMHHHYLFMSQEDARVVSKLFNRILYPNDMDTYDMALVELQKKQEILFETEKSARDALHIPQSNTYLLIQKIWRKIDNCIGRLSEKIR
ncbi:MAG: hypothetical protein GYB48_09635 [Gammaproteobacteria bacterium]|nr:hypothetical protein [Gammaproteobacteria bacterium]